MVTKDMRKASVFRKYGIDFCCGGKRTLQQVCADKNINFTSIEADLLESEKGISALPVNAGEWSPGFLADYIVEIHHSYVKKAIPDLLAWSEKVARVHGMEHPETVQVHKVFSNVCEELESHMVKEENVLFPYIRELDEARKAGGFAQRPDFGTVKNPISMMEHEHEYVGELIMKIQKLTDHYNPPSGACNTFRALLFRAERFRR